MRKIRLQIVISEDQERQLRQRIHRKGDLSRIVSTALAEYLVNHNGDKRNGTAT